MQIYTKVACSFAEQLTYVHQAPTGTVRTIQQTGFGIDGRVSILGSDGISIFDNLAIYPKWTEGSYCEEKAPEI
jgi:hypothetical protein